MGLEFFTNDRYEMLIVLKKNQVSIKDEAYVPLSQQEIADMVHFSKLKTNRILNELIKMGYVVSFMNKRGKYALTKRGYELIDLIQNTNI
jgi:predicted transcriptional regulator